DRNGLPEVVGRLVPAPRRLPQPPNPRQGMGQVRLELSNRRMVIDELLLDRQGQAELGLRLRRPPRPPHQLPELAVALRQVAPQGGAGGGGLGGFPTGRPRLPILGGRPRPLSPPRPAPAPGAVARP